ncbi:MAG: F0F1 ATP synthase subunit beta, partial [Verrucomicrobiota bacterium]
MSNIGTIVQIIGPVIDAEFNTKEGKLPKIYDAIEVDYTVDGKPAKVTLEVQQHLGENWVRAIAMSSTEGLKRGMPVRSLGKPISVPVGEGVLGRIFNVLGEPCDERGPVKADKYLPSYRSAPPLV